MRYLAVILFFCACAEGRAGAHAAFTPRLQEAFGHIVEMRFEEARNAVALERKSNPENKVPDYLEGAILCISLFVNEDETRFEQNQDRIDFLISSIEELPESEPYRNLFLGELYVAQAILNGKFKNNFTAAWQFYKSYSLLTTNYRAHPGFMPNLVPLGVLYAAIGSLPDDYRSMASLLGFEGSVQQGMSMLRKAFYTLDKDQELSFYRPYAGFIYSFTSFQLDPGQKVSPESLGLDVSKSSFLLYLQAQIELQNGEPQKAAKWLEQRPGGEAYVDFHYLDYLQGKVLLGLRPDESLNYFQRYLRTTTTSAYVKSTYRYLSWYYLLDGKRRKAAEMRELVFKKGTAETGADQQALNDARQPINPILIEARVMFDAAKYNEARTLLVNNPANSCCDSPDEKAEYNYRWGRIEQQLNNLSTAREKFEEALSVIGAQPTYATGNSALQLALIHEKAGAKKEAREYFKKAQGYSGYPFYEGVHQKAKAGISRLKKS